MFRLLDGINPLDNTFGGPFEDLDDRRIPLWMLRGSYNLGNAGPFYSITLEGFWVPGSWDARVAPSAPLGDELFQKFVDTSGDILVGVAEVENNLAEGIKHPDGKAHLHIPVLDEWVAKVNPENELAALEGTGYPMLLAAGGRSDFNANTRMRNRAWTAGKHVCALSIHTEDAKALGLETGGKALVETEAASLEVEVEVSDRPYRGMVTIQHGFGLEHCGKVDGVNVNNLTSARNRDPLAGTPLHKFIPCKVSAK